LRTLRNSPERRRERGVTILIVAIALIAILAMSALAIDIVALYVTEGDAQRAADAAALAGAKAFVSSGFTSGQLGDPLSGGSQSLVCNGSSGYADLQAQGIANLNPIGGVAPTTVTTSCTFPDGNPQITATVQRSGLPSFFARIWGGGSATVTRTAKAEAYNPSGQSVPIEVQSVKPWLIANCDPDTTHTVPANPNCPVPAAYIFNPAANYAIANPINGSTPHQFTPVNVPNPPNLLGNYYPINIPILPPVPSCPSTGAVSCGNLNTGGGHADYRRNIACSGTFVFNNGQQIGPGQTVTVDTNSAAVIKNTTIEGTECLIHADTTGLGVGEDTINPTLVGARVTITGGYNNPNPALRTGSYISRSDSVVTIPVYELVGVGTNLCPTGVPCTGTGKVVGFLQLGIQDVDVNGRIDAVILTAAGANPANTGTCSSGTAICGGRVSPIPVRLIQ